MIIVWLGIGLAIVVAVAVIGKMFSLLLTFGLLLIIASVMAWRSGNISIKQMYVAVGIATLITLSSFLLLFL